MVIWPIEFLIIGDFVVGSTSIAKCKRNGEFPEILQKIIYLSNTFISSNPIFIHHNYFQRIIFQFFHWNVKFKLLVKLGIQCILFNRSFLFFCPLTTIMEPNFCIRILKFRCFSISTECDLEIWYEQFENVTNQKWHEWTHNILICKRISNKANIYEFCQPRIHNIYGFDFFAKI